MSKNSCSCKILKFDCRIFKKVPSKRKNARIFEQIFGRFSFFLLPLTLDRTSLYHSRVVIKPSAEAPYTVFGTNSRTKHKIFSFFFTKNNRAVKLA
ncbi:MAG: hypothetical protein MUF71_03175, partial [Candidatus Kapabacteria bacterium]|nr:hypothetical protein [Candidatus Kapabacteria bacterium]